MPRAFSPTGSLIIGTADLIPGNALISLDSFERLPDGGLDFDWDGETDVGWDGQETKRSDTGKDLYVDEDGEEWTDDEITVVGEEPQPEIIEGNDQFKAGLGAIVTDWCETSELAIEAYYIELAKTKERPPRAVGTPFDGYRVEPHIPHGSGDAEYRIVDGAAIIATIDPLMQLSDPQETAFSIVRTLRGADPDKTTTIAALAAILPYAESHVENWETGAEDGTYDDNESLPAARAAIDRASDLLNSIAEAEPALPSRDLVFDLWNFIENVTDDDPERQDKFFALRERVRELQS